MTITKSGELASFYTVNKAPIKHLRVYFSPKQAGSGDPSPSNVREISGWDGIEIYTTGKNLFDTSKKYQSSNTQVTIGQNRGRGSFKIFLKAGTYTITTITSTNAAVYIARKSLLNSSNKIGNTNKSNTFIIDFDDWYEFFIYKSTGITINEVISFQLEYNTAAMTYEHYKGSIQTLDWSNDIGTVYGGYVDLITGEIYKNWVENDITSLNTSSLLVALIDNLYGAGYYSMHGEITYSSTDNLAQLFKCNVLTSSIEQSLEPPYIYVRPYSDNKRTIIYIMIGKQDDADFVNNQNWIKERVHQWMIDNQIQIIRKRDYQLEGTLTPQQLQTLIGQNNIWSNADRVEVEYDLAESNDELYRRRNILLRSAPHIVTPEPATLQHFNTNIAAPLKECKIHFNPIQEGSGDPSPNNVRQIEGYSGLNVRRTGKNLFDETNAVRYVKYISYGSLTGSSWRQSDDSASYTVKVKGNTKYTIKANNGNITIFRLGILLTDPADAPLNIHLDYAYNTNDAKTFTITTPSVDECWLILQYNKAIADARTGEIQVELGQTATEYEPYFCETIPVSFPVINNLLNNISSTSNTTLNGTDGSTFSENGMAVTNYIPVKENEIYKLSFISTEGARTRRIFGYDSNKDPVSSLASASWVTIGTSYTLTATIPNGVSYIRVCYLNNDTDKILEGPDAHTLYGGYVDLVNGELVEEWYQQSIKDYYWGIWGTNTVLMYVNHTSKPRLAGTTVYSDTLPITGAGDPQKQDVGVLAYYGTDSRYPSYFFLKTALEPGTTRQQNQNWIEETYPNAKVVFKLQTPIVHQLTPQSLKTLRGTNNIWSNTNGPIELSYWTH